MNKIEKTAYTLDIESTLKLLESVPINWKNQLCVTSRTGNDLLDGVGSINDYSDSNERDFNKLNSFFKNTDIERLLSSISQSGYSYGRVRLMKLNPKTTYSYHMDTETRLHFALDTNQDNMFIIDDEVFRIPSDGFGYHMDTTKYHTAINCSNSIRIHLVIDLLIPVVKIKELYDTSYFLLNRRLTQKEFNDWLIETKPMTETERMDYYFIEDTHVIEMDQEKELSN